MKHRNVRAYSATALITLLCSSLLVIRHLQVSGSVQHFDVGAGLQNISVHEISGRSIPLQQLVAGRTSIVVFVKPTCEHCEIELGMLEKLGALQKAKVNLIVVAEESLTSPDITRAFINENAKRFHIVLDDSESPKRRSGRLLVPTLLMLDPNGVVRIKIVGERDSEYINQEIKQFIASVNSHSNF